MDRTAEQWAALIVGRALHAFNEGRESFLPAYSMMKQALAEARKQALEEAIRLCHEGGYLGARNMLRDRLATKPAGNFYGGSSVYGLHPTSEEVACIAAARERPEPISVWAVRRAQEQKELPPRPDDPGSDQFEDGEVEEDDADDDRDAAWDEEAEHLEDGEDVEGDHGSGR